MAYALFSSNTQIERHARRLAMLGFNLVRLHHHDTTGWVVPTVIDKHLPNSRMLDRNGIDRVDYWIKCLHDNGIYVWLDMHSYRQFRDGDRQTELGTIATFQEFSGKRFGNQVKGFCQYDPVVQKLMIEFQEKYLNHVNRYTNVAYKDDPTIAFALITNENDITHHYGILAIPREKHPQLTELWQARLKQFAAKTGFNENEMRMPLVAGTGQHVPQRPGTHVLRDDDAEHPRHRLPRADRQRKRMGRQSPVVHSLADLGRRDRRPRLRRSGPVARPIPVTSRTSSR